MARLASEQLGDEHRVAVVFGREKWGLTGREVMLCQRTASIPRRMPSASRAPMSLQATTIMPVLHRLRLRVSVDNGERSLDPMES